MSTLVVPAWALDEAARRRLEATESRPDHSWLCLQARRESYERLYSTYSQAVDYQR